MAVKKKKEVKKLYSKFFNTKERVIGASAVAAVIILAIIIFMFLEISNHGKMIIENNSGINLEYINTCFVGTEGSLTPTINIKSINTGNTQTIAIDPVDLSYKKANLEVKFKLADNPTEFLTDVGFFNDDFTGNINISLTKTDDPNLIKLTIKAKNGLFQSQLINCDESAMVNLSEGLVMD